MLRLSFLPEDRQDQYPYAYRNKTIGHIKYRPNAKVQKIYHGTCPEPVRKVPQRAREDKRQGELIIKSDALMFFVKKKTYTDGAYCSDQRENKRLRTEYPEGAARIMNKCYVENTINDRNGVAL